MESKIDSRTCQNTKDQITDALKGAHISAADLVYAIQPKRRSRKSLTATNESLNSLNSSFHDTDFFTIDFIDSSLFRVSKYFFLLSSHDSRMKT